MASRHGLSNGPDVTDVATLLAAIQSLHGVRVSLEMSPAGEYGEGGFQVVAIAWKRTRGIGEAVRAASVKSHFPGNGSKTLEGCLFKLGHELDSACSALWSQMTF